jgi:hypothetical protein
MKEICFTFDAFGQWSARYFLLCVVQDEEVVEWSEASTLIWPI